METHLFGPLRSRRLGLSLGVDIIPRKTCSLDCVYCEVGLTTRFAIDPAPYGDVAAIADEIGTALEGRPDIDWITFSGSGEPTLNALLGSMIREIKARMTTPVAVITNGTLLWRPEVRSRLLQADAVLPSLDAVSPEAFRRINRPHPLLDPARVVEGLVEFRRAYAGEIWLEILLAEGLNDDDAEIELLRDAVARIRPDKVHLNTVVRPPAEAWARPVSAARMLAIAARFGGACEVVSPVPADVARAARGAGEEALLELLARRPMTAAELGESLAIGTPALDALLDRLVSAGRVEHRRFDDREFLSLRGREHRPA
jgi:wyosine [tRNA(Phe)-imidazoG37] synthetase (radical SAM superfamily)